MKIGTLLRILTAALTLLPLIHCAAAPPAKTTVTKTERKPDKASKTKQDRVRESYNEHANILRKVRFKGDIHTNNSYIEFNNDSNFIYIKFHTDYRQGKITNLGKSGPESLEGAYWIQTWKPQNYIGHRTGPSRANFKSFKLVWKVNRVSNAEFTGRVLHLQVFASPALTTRAVKPKKLHDFKLREQSRGY